MGSHIQPLSHWTTGWIHLLPKRNKTLSKQQALRPIGLQHPVNKAFAGIQCQLILTQTFPTLRQLPLYPSVPSRELVIAFPFWPHIADKFVTLVVNFVRVPMHGVLGRLADLLGYGKGL